MDSNNSTIELLRKCAVGDSRLQEAFEGMCLQEVFEGIIDEIEAQYIKLPVDADGVPIRPGDEIQFGTNAPVHVYSIGTSRCDCGDFGWFGSDGGFYGRGTLSSCRHVKPDTVEDIIEDIWLDDDWHCLDDDASKQRIADYAERIRKAVEDE